LSKFKLNLTRKLKQNFLAKRSPFPSQHQLNIEIVKLTSESFASPGPTAPTTERVIAKTQHQKSALSDVL
jgi:hypothetical protein